jgi:ADP-ribose pyrophosphatase
MRRVAGRIVYSNRWMSVREDQIEHPDGSSGVYGVVDKEDYAVVIPQVADEFVLVEQFRYPVQGRYWEFPQGSWEGKTGVAPEDIARAELAEETGYRAGAIRHLARIFGAYGFCSQGCNIFYATDLTSGAPEREAEEQGMKVARFRIEQLEEMIRSGRIKDAATIAAYGLLRLV